MEKEGVGTFGGQAKLTINGNSIRDMAAAADGELAVIMDGGQINALIIEALGSISARSSRCSRRATKKGKGHGARSVPREPIEVQDVS